MMEAAFKINGKTEVCSFEPADVLLDVLRAGGHIDVRAGCREGKCGTCSVLLDGKLVYSCQVFAASAAGKAILTVSGLGSIHQPHPLQTAFVECGAIQCGFCTPGMILAAYSLLQQNPDPDENEIKRALDGNLCRCSGYVKIIEAVLLAAERMRSHG